MLSNCVAKLEGLYRRVCGRSRCPTCLKMPCVDIHRNMAGLKRCYRHLGILEKFDGCPLNHGQKSFGMFIHPLTHGPLGRNMANIQRFSEELVGPILFNNNEIALAL